MKHCMPHSSSTHNGLINDFDYSDFEVLVLGPPFKFLLLLICLHFDCNLLLISVDLCKLPVSLCQCYAHCSLLPSYLESPSSSSEIRTLTCPWKTKQRIRAFQGCRFCLKFTRVLQPSPLDLWGGGWGLAGSSSCACWIGRDTGGFPVPKRKQRWLCL